MGSVTFTFPVTTCAICGERDWRHVSVLGAGGSYCAGCSAIAMLGVRVLQDRHMAECRRTGVFTLTPQWKPAKEGGSP
jgi:hypothetical protein